jgi:hypothetical protein
MTGAEAKAAFDRANALVNEGRYDEARAVPMLESDKAVIETYIGRHQAKVSASENTA